MKGIIFNVLNQMVEEKLGEEAWEELLEQENPASGGAYTSAGSYPDEELFSLVGAISKKTGTPVNDLVRDFGTYTLGKLAEGFPVFFEGKDLKEFLLSIHDVVHVEVKKLYPDAVLPEFKYEDPGGPKLMMKYRSERKLCPLAEGLIQGAANHFKKEISIAHPRCLTKGDPECQIEVSIKG